MTALIVGLVTLGFFLALYAAYRVGYDGGRLDGLRQGRRESALSIGMAKRGKL